MADRFRSRLIDGMPIAKEESVYAKLRTSANEDGGCETLTTDL